MTARVYSLDEARRRLPRWPNRHELRDAMLEDMQRRGHTGCALLQEERAALAERKRRRA